ncbi:MAG: regulatory protein RecX [Deltaproteobacteria bacterium]|nr:regulatory protein RecX [Deltaproteobacteria bacterium]
MNELKASKKARETALRFIALRERSIAEVRSKLIKTGSSVAEADEAIGHLKNAGYLDDARFAFLLAASRAKNKLWGKRRIAAALASKGVESDIIANCLAAVDGEAEEKAAKAAFEKWLKKNGSPRSLDKKLFAKAMRHLIGRGFSTNVALKTIGGRNNDGDPPDDD